MTAKALRRIESEDVRRRRFIEATIDSIADDGFAATTLARIAARAGVSPGLIAHYFGDKDGLLEATLRHLAGEVGRAHRVRLATARSPRERIQAVIDANLDDSEFDRRTATVWLAFWAEVPHSARSRRIQRVYEQRMLSNLVFAFSRLVSRPEAQRLARGLAAVIDGLWLRATLSERIPRPHEARRMATAFVDGQLALLGLALLDSEGARR